MTASALPAVLIRLPMSGDAGPSLEPLRGCDLADMADMAESIDEFRGNPFAASPWAAATGPAMGRRGGLGVPSGLLVNGSETLRLAFVCASGRDLGITSVRPFVSRREELV